MIPDQPVQDLTQLSSGLSVVTTAADTLQQFNREGLDLLQQLALDFVADNQLQVDSTGGALAYVLRSGSIALVSFYLSVIDGAPSLLSHRLHALPAFQGQELEEVIKLDLPPVSSLLTLLLRPILRVFKPPVLKRLCPKITRAHFPKIIIFVP